MSIRFVSIYLLLISLLTPPLLYAQSITVKDIVGRTVTLKAPAKRVILGEGRSLISLSLLHPRPTQLVAGWTGDFKKSGGLLYDEYVKRFPEITKIPTIGVSGKETVSTEKIISLRPDLAIFGAGSHGPDAKSVDVIRQLEAAGVPIVFIDFRLHPLENTIPSMRILGKVLGREKQANDYLEFYEQKKKEIIAKLPKQSSAKPPKVYMEMIRGVAVGSPGKGNLGEFINFAKGHNIGADIIPGEVGSLNMEFVIQQQPDVYIATGIALPGEQGLEIGYGISEDRAKSSLQKLASRSVVRSLNAVQAKNVYGMWHIFYDSPLNILALEAIAKWIHPASFDANNPAKTLNQINEQFLAVPFKGTYFTKLN